MSSHHGPLKSLSGLQPNTKKKYPLQSAVGGGISVLPTADLNCVVLRIREAS